MQEELMVNESAFSGDQESCDAIREAIEKLSTASQEQFETMKKEKWYNRVFDMVTFSQKGKKRLAEQVGTLAQAQQIFIELLLRLSSSDVNISNIVRKSMEDIRKISEQNIYLLTRIKHLEDISLGIKADMDINNLSERDKQVLCGLLYKINSENSNTSNEQRAYVNAVMSYLAMDIQMDNPLVALDKMDSDSKKRILTCCMEYIFLQDCTQKSFDDNREFINEFDIGNKTIKEITEQIIARFNLRGADGFCSKYISDNFKEPEEFFSIEFEAVDEQGEEEEKEPVEMTDETISSILQIHSGETKSYENKFIHFAAYVNCEGTLEIDHCAIYYNESESGDEITLAEGANLYVRDSVVICKGFDTNHFISCAGKNEVVFENTIFYDCSYMITSGNPINFTMKGCKLKDCYHKFVNIYVGEKNVCDISKNIIIQDNLCKFHIDNRTLIGRLFDISGYSSCKESKNIRFYDNTINEGESFTDKKGSENYIEYFRCSVAEVFNCTFTGISKAIIAMNVRECKFEKCKEAICIYKNGGIIDNCVFENCTYVIRPEKNTQITNCQFISCYDDIIFSDSHGGVHIEFCEFVNTKNLRTEDKIQCSIWGASACIKFDRHGSDSKANYLKKCIFDGVKLKDDFLIAANGRKKPSGNVAYIEECSFKNCSTKRASGKIIKEYLQYDTAFKKNQDFHAIEISRCKGLDKINKERPEADHVEARTQATTGNIIGSSLVNAVAVRTLVALGGPTGLGVAAGISAINEMNKDK